MIRKIEDDPLRSRSQSVTAAYAGLDAEIAAFQAETGLECPSGCGQCCENPTVDATPLELLPLVLELFRRGETTLWLERARALGSPGVCAFYQPDPVVPGNGRCRAYAWRPSLCRLFGFAAVRTKTGRPELAACARHKTACPSAVDRARAAIAAGVPVPTFADFATQVAALDPSWGGDRLPINEALQVAIERVGLWLQMTGGGLPEETSDRAS